MGKGKVREWLEGKELELFGVCSAGLLLLVCVAVETAGWFGVSPEGEESGVLALAQGLWKIVVSRDALITDYFELAGYGAAFLNGALVFGIALVLLFVEKVKFTGLTMAALFINAGYAFWGKNPVNILPILLGTFLYAKLHKSRLSRFIYTALFGTCLAPLVTELVFILPFGKGINLLISVVTGIFIGFVLPPLSMHTASMHMGYNLFNVGFSAGMLAFVLVCVLSSLGIESDSVLIWREGRPVWIILGLYGYFVLTFLYGLFLCEGKVKGLLKIWHHPGRAVADFVMMDGAGTTLMNMALVGSIATTYICLIGGDFSGPVVGGILAAFGFAAFGAHVKNYLPVLVGVFVSTFVTRFELTTPGIQLAAVFAVGLAPIAGQFGVIAGMVAGILHAIIVMCTAPLYGGLNLYNNGFSAGWVAIVMIPVLESFMTRFQYKRRAQK